MKNWRTTLVGAIGMLFLIVGLILVVAKVITFNDLVNSLALVSPFIVMIATYLTKDKNVTGGTVKQ